MFNWKQAYHKYGCSEKGRKRNREYVRRLRIKLLLLLNNKCVRCNIIEDLQIDHKNGGGTAERRRLGGPQAMYRYYLNNPEEAKEKLQVLCAFHNMEKRRINKEYIVTPHSQRRKVVRKRKLPKEAYPKLMAYLDKPRLRDSITGKFKKLG